MRTIAHLSCRTISHSGSASWVWGGGGILWGRGEAAEDAGDHEGDFGFFVGSSSACVYFCSSFSRQVFFFFFLFLFRHVFHVSRGVEVIFFQFSTQSTHNSRWSPAAEYQTWPTTVFHPYSPKDSIERTSLDESGFLALCIEECRRRLIALCRGERYIPPFPVPALPTPTPAGSVKFFLALLVPPYHSMNH